MIGMKDIGADGAFDKIVGISHLPQTPGAPIVDCTGQDGRD